MGRLSAQWSRVVGDVHFAAMFVVVCFFVDFFGAQAEQILELFYVVVLFLRLYTESSAHVEAIFVPGLLAGALIVDVWVEVHVHAEIVVIRILVRQSSRLHDRNHCHWARHHLPLWEAHHSGLRRV